jgi:hypothetical protein
MFGSSGALQLGMFQQPIYSIYLRLYVAPDITGDILRYTVGNATR